MARDIKPVWLDVGCGSGALAMTAADFGYDSIGLDARLAAVERIASLGFKARHGDFIEVDFDAESVEVVSMMDILEHIPYPRSALDHARRVLKAGGLLIVSAPDLQASSWRMMDQVHGNPYWMEIEHHHNFSRDLIFSLLKEHGFSIDDFAVPYRYRAQMEIYARKT